MTEIVYRYPATTASTADLSDIRWLKQDDLSIFEEHLALCGQQFDTETLWDEIWADGTEYCVLYADGKPVARACIEKYSADKWEVSDVRTAREYRGRGFAYRICAAVRNAILAQGKIPTIRTEADNLAMRRVIEKLGFAVMGDTE